MRKLLYNLINKEKIGIYKFHNEEFVVGKIISIQNDYVMLKSYDVDNKEDGLKFFLLDIVERIILKSEYLKKLERKKTNLMKYEDIFLTDTKLDSLKMIYKLLIEKKIPIKIQFNNYEPEEGYIKEIKKGLCYFDVIDENNNIISNDVFWENNIESIEIEVSDIIKKESETKKIKLISEIEYIGKELKAFDDTILFHIFKENLESQKIVIIKKERILEKTKLRNVEKIFRIDDKNIFDKFEKMSIVEILKTCKVENIVIFIDNMEYDETKVGIVNDVNFQEVELKLLDSENRFIGITNIPLQEIQILYVKKYKIL